MKIAESTQRALAEIAKLLADGFTGRIEIECRDGGVGEWREVRVHRAPKCDGLTKMRQ